MVFYTLTGLITLHNKLTLLAVCFVLIVYSHFIYDALTVMVSLP